MGAAVAAQAFCIDDRPHLRQAVVHILVNQHIVIFAPMPDFAGSAAHPAFDDLFRVRAASAEAPLQFAHRWRQDEDPDQVGPETYILISASASRSIREMVVLPAPEGEERTISKPRRRRGWVSRRPSMAILASVEPCTSSDGMLHRTKKVLKWCGAMHIVQCNNLKENEMANETQVEATAVAEAAAEAPAKAVEA